MRERDGIGVTILPPCTVIQHSSVGGKLPARLGWLPLVQVSADDMHCQVRHRSSDAQYFKNCTICGSCIL